MKETDLYRPIATYLENQGYQVNSEVKNCDITAVKKGEEGDELIVVELKTRFSLALVYQAVDRKSLTDSVYCAVPVMGSKAVPPHYKSLKNLLRRLEIGLILVRFLKKTIRVEVMLHPQSYEIRRRPKRREMIIREIEGRYGEFNKGGSSTRVERITTYKQEAIRIAWQLSCSGEMSPKALRDAGCGPKTQQILSANYYGWFNRVRRGVYLLDKEGYKAIEGYKEIIDALKNKGRKK